MIDILFIIITFDTGCNITTIAAGASHVIVITSPTGGYGSGEIYTWGCGTSGQLGLGDDVYNIEKSHVQIPRRVQVITEEKAEMNE